MGRWIERDGDWFEREHQAPAPDPPAPPPAPSEERVAVVIWVPVFCPHCHSRDCPVTATLPARPGMRYHHCRVCDCRFKSFERDPAK